MVSKQNPFKDETEGIVVENEEEKIKYDYVQCTKKNFFKDEKDHGRHPNKPNNIGVKKI